MSNTVGDRTQECMQMQEDARSWENSPNANGLSEMRELPSSHRERVDPSPTQT